MALTQRQQALLKLLPSIDRILLFLKQGNQLSDTPKTVLLASARSVLEDFRRKILDEEENLTDDDLALSAILENVRQAINQSMTPKLRRLVNAAGVVVHTNLGRSLLSENALRNVITIAGRYSNLEFDLASGKRGLRYSHIEEILCEITGAEAALAVNNNAAAVLLCLDTIANGREVIVSRGELVEIGGSFRIPEVMAKSGALLKEVGTTNRTHLRDYENAINENTGLLLKVHPSNYSVVGFTTSVPLKEVVEVGKKHTIPVMEDLGSGTLIDFSKYGLTKEPTVQEAVAAGADMVTFSGDKLLGGPQAGIILGNKTFLDRIKKNPLTRALRIDKMTLAALENTLRLYYDETRAIQAIPTLRMLTMPFEVIEGKALQLKKMLEELQDPRLNIHLLNLSSRVGGGSLPLLELPSKCIGIKIKGVSANAIERHMRNHSTPIIGRIEEDRFIIDPRTLQDDELSIIKEAFMTILAKAE